MAEMTFWDHLDELRKVLFRVVGVWFVLAIGYFIAMPYLFDHVILAPCHNDFIFYDLLRHIGKTFDLTDDFFTQQFYVKLVNINLAAPFFIHMSTAFWMSVVTAMPYIFFEIWRFGYMVAFFNGSGQQVLPAEIPPSCGCRHSDSCCYYYSDGRPVHLECCRYSALSVVRDEYFDDKGQEENRRGS